MKQKYDIILYRKIEDLNMDENENVTICCDCQYCCDKYSFPLPNDIPEFNGNNFLLKAYCCCMEDCELYGKRIDMLGITSCEYFKEL